MVFSSITFLLYFFPVVFIVYYLLSFSRVCQNIWLLLTSLFFYAWGEPVYVLLMIGSIFFNWMFGLLIGANENQPFYRKLYLIIACILNLGVLGIFKYSAFIADTINRLLLLDLIPILHFRLPIGISFFTFQALSYVIDVYQNKAYPQKNLFAIALYISFFPQLIAGPIVRYTTIEDQIYNRKESWDLIVSGICRLSEGLIKKLLLANNLAIIADTIFNLTKDGDGSVAVPALLAWLGALAYSLQLFYDFSAYSDMAIGLGMMFGFTFPENFRYPFAASSIREFMSKWHISLTTWFTQYVYKPLGGSRNENQDKMVKNMFLVWVLTGLWHGAAWTYIGWGVFYFCFILFEVIVKMDQSAAHPIIRHLYVIIVTLLAMVIFRCENGIQLLVYLKNMVCLNKNGFLSSTALMFIKEYGIVLAFAILFSIPTKDFIADKLAYSTSGNMILISSQIAYIVFMPLLLVFCIAVLAKGAYNPFIYFNF
ncbi:MAG: MBOAT family protein [Treponema sp.]|nr:MBOAT family protein [Treponema sp.]